MGRKERKWAQWPLQVISPVFKQQHESQACFWSPAQNVNCNLSHQPKDVVWKWILESLHINGGTLWGLCTSYSSNGSSWFCRGFYLQLMSLRNLGVLHCKTKTWHTMSVYIQEVCAITRPSTGRELCWNFSLNRWIPLFVQIKEVSWINLTGLFLWGSLLEIKTSFSYLRWLGKEDEEIWGFLQGHQTTKLFYCQLGF